MKVSCTLGSKGSWSDYNLPTIGKAGDILELVDYPEKGSSKQYICVRYPKASNDDLCELCEMDYMSDGHTRLCLYMECKCQCNRNNTYLCAIDTVMENL